MSLFLPKIKFLGKPRKRGSYWQFRVLVGGHLIGQNFRFYPATQTIWRPMRMTKWKRPIEDWRMSKPLETEILKLCKGRWPGNG